MREPLIWEEYLSQNGCDLSERVPLPVCAGEARLGEGEPRQLERAVGTEERR